MSGALLMARPKGGARPKRKEELPPSQAARVTVINLKGSQEQADWLDAVNRKTHIPKAAIVRLALELWGQKSGHPPFPASEDDR
jgi:hypothetical protein